MRLASAAKGESRRGTAARRAGGEGQHRCSGFLNKFLNQLGLIPYEAHLSFSSGGVARPGVVLTDLQSPIHL